MSKSEISAAKHTPGPWGTHFHPSHGHCITQLNEHGNPKTNDIAVVFMAGNGRTREQCKADARLIAASPDLLRVAELLVDWLNEDEGAHKLCDTARAAIAKATRSAQ